jgi:Zn finger protein HypA/HybF involved in hydrogenase expression
MPENVECGDCGLTLLGIEATEEPIGYDNCPECGNDEFHVVG